MIPMISILFNYDGFEVYMREYTNDANQLYTFAITNNNALPPTIEYFWREAKAKIEYGPFKSLWETIENVKYVRNPKTSPLIETKVITVDFRKKAVILQFTPSPNQ